MRLKFIVSGKSRHNPVINLVEPCEALIQLFVIFWRMKWK